MDRETLTSDLASQAELNWRVSDLRAVQYASHSVSWVPVASLISPPGSLALHLGLSSQGRWLVVSPDGTVDDFEARQSYLHLFPLMEMSRADVTEMLLAEFATHRLNQAWIEYFPFEEILAAALKYDSKFWPDFALQWVPSFSRTAAIMEALEVLNKQGRTQQQRHRAKRLLLEKCKELQTGIE